VAFSKPVVLRTTFILKFGYPPLRAEEIEATQRA
jgi:hypothetical protein